MHEGRSFFFRLFKLLLMGIWLLMPKIRPLFLSALAVLISAVFIFSFTSAQRSAIETYAITNARIVTVSGPVIDRGTVVIRDGLIAAVGPNVSAPADARIIDGAGLTVYPGLIDANTSLGLPQPAATPAASPTTGGGGGFGQLRPQSFLTALNSAQPAGLQPEVLVEDFVRPRGEQFEAALSRGITTALSAPRTGIWMGQSALINLAGDSTQEMIVKSPVAMHVGFTPLRGSTYPNSLLGVFSALRQMLTDAERYREAQRAYERAPRGTRRPEHDRSLAALLPVLDGTMPVVMYADQEREISRALDLAQEYKLRAIIAGGLESDKVATRLRDSKVPVLLSLNFPRRTAPALPEADPEPIRVLRQRVEAPKVAGRLAAARVRFAFQSGALASSADFHPNLLRAIESGLSRDDALRALTIWPAEIFGVADRTGSIEVGKIANLIITRGDLFDRARRLAYVFVDGRQMELRTPAAGAPEATATGSWSVNVNLGSGPVAITLDLQQEGDRLRGSMQGALGSGELANATTTPGGDVRFTVPITFEGQTSEATFAGRITGNQIQGSVNVVGRSPGTFTGTRAGSAQPEASPSPTPE